VAAFAEPILSLLFGSDPNAVAQASPLLSYLGVSVFLSCMITATNSVLHAYEAVNRPILSMLAGAVIKIVSAYFLIGIPNIALLGAPISTFLCNTTVVLLNLYFAFGLCRINGMSRLFFKPLLCAALSIGASVCLYWSLGQRVEQSVAFLAAFATAAFGYLLACCLFGGFSAEDLALLPFGEKLCRLLCRVHLLKKTEID